MKIQRVLVLKDNYLFMLHDLPSQQLAVVDPAVTPPILDYLRATKTKLVAIFNTHHHWDHVGANIELCQLFPDVVVYGGAHDRGRIPGQQRYLQDGDRISFGDQVATVIFVPGHTLGHIAYYFDSGDLFCGDTLFGGGCGRLLEGTPQQMLNSLNHLKQLPDSTRIWCAHEYTLNNLKFALTVEPDNLDLCQRYQQVQQMRSEGLPTIPSLLGVEKLTNPFLRSDLLWQLADPKPETPQAFFAQLRSLKDKF